MEALKPFCTTFLLIAVFAFIKNKSPTKPVNVGKRVAPEFLRPAPGEIQEQAERPKSLPNQTLEEREAFLTEDIAKNLVTPLFLSFKIACSEV